MSIQKHFLLTITGAKKARVRHVSRYGGFGSSTFSTPCAIGFSNSTAIPKKENKEFELHYISEKKRLKVELID